MVSCHLFRILQDSPVFALNLFPTCTIQVLLVDLVTAAGLTSMSWPHLLSVQRSRAHPGLCTQPAGAQRAGPGTPMAWIPTPCQASPTRAWGSFLPKCSPLS